MTRALIMIALTFSLALASSSVDFESEAREIDAALIAPCCFGQQVSVHQSAAADEVRRDVRARLAAGETRQQVLDAYVAQYGPRILAEPPASGFGRTLYIAPFVMLLVTLASVTAVIRRFTHMHAAWPSAHTGALASDTSRDENERLDDELRDLD